MYSCCGFYCNLQIRCTAGRSAGVCTSPSTSVTTVCEPWDLIVHQHYCPVRLAAKSWSSCKLFFCGQTNISIAIVYIQRDCQMSWLLAMIPCYSHLMLKWFQKFYYYCHHSKLQDWDRVPCVWLLWPPYVTYADIIFLSCFFFFPRLISSVADWMSAILLHMVWP